MLYTRIINNVEISFDDRGLPSNEPAIVCLPSLGQDHRGFYHILPYLTQKYRVIRMCWRSQGASRNSTGKWTVDDQADDTIALLDSSEIHRLIPVSHSHGGWCGMEIAARLGRDRVPAVLLTDFIQTPGPPEFVASLKMCQRIETWQKAQEGLVKGWLGGTEDEETLYHFYNDLGAHGFLSWSHLCWLVAKNYERWGSPMQRMEAISDPPLIRHVFSRPTDESYLDFHKGFEAKHPSWFSFAKLPEECHFPVVELPELVALQIEELYKTVLQREKV